MTNEEILETALENSSGVYTRKATYFVVKEGHGECYILSTMIMSEEYAEEVRKSYEKINPHFNYLIVKRSSTFEIV